MRRRTPASSGRTSSATPRPCFATRRSSSSRDSSRPPSRPCATALAMYTIAWWRSSTRSNRTWSSRTTSSRFRRFPPRAGPGSGSSPATPPRSRTRRSLPPSPATRSRTGPGGTSTGRSSLARWDRFSRASTSSAARRTLPRSRISSSSTPRPGRTSGSTRSRSTTRVSGRWQGPGTTWSRAFARPTTSGRCPSRLPQTMTR